MIPLIHLTQVDRFLILVSVIVLVAACQFGMLLLEKKGAEIENSSDVDATPADHVDAPDGPVINFSADDCEFSENCDLQCHRCILGGGAAPT